MCRRTTGFRFLLLSLLICSLMSTGCGNGDALETVHLHVLNAYPASSSLSLYGPSGAVVTDLEYGERTEEPVEVDRNLGGEFTLILDGAPVIFDDNVELFDLYPQETGTFIVSQRRDTTVAVQIVRHMATSARGCRLAVHNSLALSSASLHEYSFILGWNIPQPANAGYSQTAESNAGVPARTDLYNRINGEEYFILGTAIPDEDEDDEGGEEEDARNLVFLWPGEDEVIDYPNVDTRTGTLWAYPPSQEYIECELSGGEDCDEPRRYSARTHGPNDGSISEFLHYMPEALGNSGDDCRPSWRIYSDFWGIYEHDDNDNAVRVEIDASSDDLGLEFDRGNYLYLVLFGRPVNPSFDVWSTGQEEYGDFASLPNE